MRNITLQEQNRANQKQFTEEKDLLNKSKSLSQLAAEEKSESMSVSNDSSRQV